MSLIFFLIYWLVIPLLAIATGVSLWKRTQSKVGKGVVASVIVAVLAGFLWLAVGEKWMGDQRVRELCAKDGGVRVFETVPLTPELLDKVGRISIPDKQRARPSDEYFYVADRVRLSEGRVKISRRQVQVVRRGDGKILGEKVSYSRTGGELPGPWHSSGYTCPKPTASEKFESAIFVAGAES